MTFVLGNKSFISISFVLFLTLSFFVCNKVTEKKIELMKYKKQYETVISKNKVANEKVVQESQYEIF